MSHLEEMWNCELECFQTVERLAQCLDQRGQTWKRLAQLREQVSTVKKWHHLTARLVLLRLAAVAHVCRGCVVVVRVHVRCIVCVRWVETWLIFAACCVVLRHRSNQWPCPPRRTYTTWTSSPRRTASTE
jgi:hypothetical protein